ncbi:MAG: aminotransferase class III-fold pyridoxal phosphate-dependent enzyme, partial [Gammaproteobacteria bacterium]|nr:aminotransferase class III-fold pyridoxal phosphate-dependent enzyme [Gammaproteobacteria bacterium]
GVIRVMDPRPYEFSFGSTPEEQTANNLRYLEEVITYEGPQTIAAMFIETVTGTNGILPPPPGYLQGLRALLDKYGILLVCDEVMCGWGRTGKLFAFEHGGIVPDIVTMAKGVASGYAAISCTVTTEEVFNQFKDDENDPMSYFRDISTFGGCTAGPAAALENMAIIEEENLLQNVTENGEYLLSRLEELKAKHPIVGDVRGKGYFAGLELVADRDTKEPVHESVAASVVSDCLAQGVMIGRTNRSFAKFNNTLCLSPALIAGKSELDEIITAIDKALGKVG